MQEDPCQMCEEALPESASPTRVIHWKLLHACAGTTMHAPLFRTTRASHLLQRPTAKSPLVIYPAVETMCPPCQPCQGPCQVRCTNTTFHRVVVFCSVYATCIGRMCISAQKGLCNQEGQHIYAVHTVTQRCHQSPSILRRACLRASLLFMFCSFVIACLTLEAFVCWDPEHSNALSHNSFLKSFQKQLQYSKIWVL